MICGPEGDSSVNQFYNAYRTVAEIIGVSLADESDDDKAYRATHRGKVFGIMYDLRKWTWSLPEDKLVPIVLATNAIKEQDEVDNGALMSLNGKLNHHIW